MGKRKKKKKQEKEMKPNATKLFIDENVFRKVMHWCDKAPGEVSGMGIIEYRDGIPHVKEAWLFKQKNTGTSTDLDAEELSKFQYELHRDKVKHDDLWWWHSHKNMTAFWSGTDEDTIHELGSHGRIWATVFNCRRELKSALYMGQPFQVWIPEVPTTITYDLDQRVTAQWDKAYEEKCTVQYEPPVVIGRFNNHPQLDLHHRGFEELKGQGWSEQDILETINSDPQAVQDFDDCLDEISKCHLNKDYVAARRELMIDGFDSETIRTAWNFYFGEDEVNRANP